MKILQLSPQVPWPLSVGGKVGIFNITKHLALRRHEITLLALDTDTSSNVEPVEEYCDLIRVPHSNRNSVLGAFNNFWSDLPYNISKYRSREFQSTLVSLLKEREFDIVHVDHLHMAQYGVFCKQAAQLPIVLREHNVESVIMERFAEHATSRALRIWLSMQLSRIQRYEATQAGLFDYCCVITNEDQKRLAALQSNAHMRVIPGGVDSTYFETVPNEPAIPFSISFFGNFDWLPNQDAVLWFSDEIFPKIVEKEPRSKFFLLGKGIPEKIKRLQTENFIIKGFVPDLSKELQQYQISIVPLRIGGGIRLKILESFALRVPVVSTTIGCEGIKANNGEHILLADSANAFATQVVRLLHDQNLRNTLAKNAYDLAIAQYRWEHIAEEFEHTYIEAIENSKRLTV